MEITKNRVKTMYIMERDPRKAQAFCIFEYVYFARADSIFEGKVLKKLSMYYLVVLKESSVNRWGFMIFFSLSISVFITG